MGVVGATIRAVPSVGIIRPLSRGAPVAATMVRPCRWLNRWISREVLLRLRAERDQARVVVRQVCEVGRRKGHLQAAPTKGPLTIAYLTRETARLGG